MMRLRPVFMSLVLFGALPAAASGTDGLLTLDQAEQQTPGVEVYAEALLKLIRDGGHVCGAITHINGFPTDDGLRTVVACDEGTHRYEALSRGESVSISAAN